MTNRIFMQTLNNELFENVMHALYFRPSLWIEDNFVKQHTTPTQKDICNWLDDVYDPTSEFWHYIQS